MVFSLEVSLTGEYAESEGSGATTRQKNALCWPGAGEYGARTSLIVGEPPMSLCLSVTPSESKFLYQLSASRAVTLPASYFALPFRGCLAVSGNLFGLCNWEEGSATGN